MLRTVCTALFLFGTFAGVVQAETPVPFASYADASEQVLSDPHDLAFGPDGNIYIADKFANRITIMDPDTLEVIGSVGDGQLSGVHDVSFDANGNLYASVTNTGAVAIYDLSGDTPVSKGYMHPFPRTEGVLAHSNGRIYVMASGTGELIAVEGEKVVGIATGMFGAHDVAEAPDGSIWVADTRSQRLVQFNADLVQETVLNGPQYGLAGPRYLDIDEAGILYVADQDSHRILKIDPIGDELMGVIGNGTPGMGPYLLDDPEGVAMRGSEFFFADSDNNRIVKYVVILN